MFINLIHSFRKTDHIATQATYAEDDKDLLRKMKEKEDKLLKEIKDELKQPITDPIKESTVGYYHQNKDKVSSFTLRNIHSSSISESCLIIYHNRL